MNRTRLCERRRVEPEVVRSILERLSGPKRLMIELIAQVGLHPTECVRLRVRDIDFADGCVRVRGPNGRMKRTVPLPNLPGRAIKDHLETVRERHRLDLDEGFGRVYLPRRIRETKGVAETDWKWQYVFPAAKRSTDPESGVVRRHHFHASALGKAVRRACRVAGVTPSVTCGVLAASGYPEQTEGQPTLSGDPLRPTGE